MGVTLKGKRGRVFLMTKVCTHSRDKDLAMRMLEQSLRRLQTDHLDLWQIHGVSFENDPDLFIRRKVNGTLPGIMPHARRARCAGS